MAVTGQKLGKDVVQGSATPLFCSQSLAGAGEVESQGNFAADLVHRCSGPCEGEFANATEGDALDLPMQAAREDKGASTARGQPNGQSRSLGVVDVLRPGATMPQRLDLGLCELELASFALVAHPLRFGKGHHVVHIATPLLQLPLTRIIGRRQIQG
jgi:hypothetical protein